MDGRVWGVWAGGEGGRYRPFGRKLPHPGMNDGDVCWLLRGRHAASLSKHASKCVVRSEISLWQLNT
eukprot:93950-Prymnesium_polylepis.1